MVLNALIQDSKLHTVIQYLIPDSPLVQISPHPVKTVIGQGQGKGLLPRRWFCSGNIHRSLLTQDFYGFRISHAIYLHQKPKGRHSTDIPGFPMPFTGDLINLKTIMVLKLPFISCPCFLQSPRLVCLQILIGSHLLGCLILFFSNPGHQITALRRASTLSVRSHGNSFLPKCPKAAVCRKIGRVRRRLYSGSVVKTKI